MVNKSNSGPSASVSFNLGARCSYSSSSVAKISSSSSIIPSSSSVVPIVPSSSSIALPSSSSIAPPGSSSGNASGIPVVVTCTMSKSSYVVGETIVANTTFSGAECTGVTYTGLKRLTDVDIGLHPSGSVKVSASCLYNSQMHSISQDCSDFKVVRADEPQPILTCELDKTSYSAGDRPVVRSVVTPNGATCGTPSILGVRTFTMADGGDRPAGTIKASVTCQSMPIVTQDCPAFTVQTGCADLSKDFCYTTNVVFLDTGNDPYHYDNGFQTNNAICLKITKSYIRNVQCDSRHCRINGGEFFTGTNSGTFEKIPNDECGVIYLDVLSGYDSHYPGFLGFQY
ncbi:hypothetical protein R83H12_01742 [Fibrobacteria bacterium R8-3-H12]